MLRKSDCATFYDVKNEQFQRKLIKNAWIKNNKVQKSGAKQSKNKQM